MKVTKHLLKPSSSTTLSSQTIANLESFVSFEISMMEPKYVWGSSHEKRTIQMYIEWSMVPHLDDEVKVVKNLIIIVL